jgi:DNA-directed RNA polymerase specialized sigma24 family protein
VAFLLHVLEGKSLLEISELCGYSVATAKRRLARAQRRFERLVAREPELRRMLARARLDAAFSVESNDAGGGS